MVKAKTPLQMGKMVKALKLNAAENESMLGKNAPSAMLLDEHAVVKNSVDFEKKARRQVKNR